MLNTQFGTTYKSNGDPLYFYQGFGDAQDNHGDKFAIQFTGPYQSLYWYKNDDIFFQQTDKDLTPK